MGLKRAMQVCSYPSTPTRNLFPNSTLKYMYELFSHGPETARPRL